MTEKKTDSERAKRDWEILKRDSRDVAERDIRREATGKQIVKEIIAEREEFAEKGLTPLRGDIRKLEDKEYYKETEKTSENTDNRSY